MKWVVGYNTLHSVSICTICLIIVKIIFALCNVHNSRRLLHEKTVPFLKNFFLSHLQICIVFNFFHIIMTDFQFQLLPTSPAHNDLLPCVMNCQLSITARLLPLRLRPRLNPLFWGRNLWWTNFMRWIRIKPRPPDRNLWRMSFTPGGLLRHLLCILLWSGLRLWPMSSRQPTPPSPRVPACLRPCRSPTCPTARFAGKTWVPPTPSSPRGYARQPACILFPLQLAWVSRRQDA